MAESLGARAVFSVDPNKVTIIRNGTATVKTLDGSSILGTEMIFRVLNREGVTIGACQKAIDGIDVEIPISVDGTISEIKALDVNGKETLQFVTNTLIGREVFGRDRVHLEITME